MKLQSIQSNNVYQTNIKKQEFKGAADAVLVGFWDLIAKGGTGASFILQDVCGSVAPRTWIELNRGKEDSGKLNYTGAAETAIRECTTSPTLFAVPAVTIWLISQAVGKANNLPLSQIDDFTSIMKETLGEMGEEAAKANPKAFKEAFYNKVIGSICEGTFEGKMKPETLKQQVEKIDEIVENVVSSKGKVKKSDLDEIFKQLDASFASVKQHSGADYASAFSNAVLKKGGSEDRVSNLFKNAENYYAEFSKKLSKSDVEAGQLLDSFKKSRLNSRAATGIIATAATMAAMFMLPKLYQLKKPEQNFEEGMAPDVSPCEDNKQEGEKVAFKGGMPQAAKSSNGKVAFKGGIAGATAAGGASLLSKLGKFFDPKGKAISPGALTLVLSTCVVIPRLLNARDNTERREVFTRDVPTVATVLFANKGISGLIAKAAEKKSGAVITNGPTDYRELGAFAKFKNLFKPNGGVTVFGNEDIVQKYSNIKDQETFTKMLEYVKKSGGDVKKVLSIDEKSKTHSMFDFAKNALGDNFKDMADEDILKALKSADNEAKVSEFVKNVLDNEKANPIIASCKKTSGVIKWVSFAIAICILGIALPKLNVFLAKKSKGKECEGGAQADKMPPQGGDVAPVAGPREISDLIEAKHNEAEKEAFKNFVEV